LRLVLAFTLLSMLSACVKPAAAPSQARDVTDASEILWTQLTVAAKPEGKLVLATNNNAIREEMAEAFSKRFGIEVEVVTGRGTDTIARIMRERAAGIQTVDVLISGLGTVASELYPAKGLASIKQMMVIPDVADTAKWRDGKIRFADPDDEYVLRSLESIQNNIIINTDFVARDDLRRSDDLLNPKFQGKIATADPLAQGGGDVVAGYFLKFKGDDFVKRLYVDQKPIASRDDRQMSDWMARGVYPINLTMTEEDVLDLIKDGIKLEAFSFDDIPPQIGAGGSFLTAMSPAPHPNAARLWVNWFASKEGQELAAAALGQPSNRLDVQANAKLPSFLIPQPGREYFDINDWNFSKEQADLRARMRSLLGS